MTFKPVVVAPTFNNAGTLVDVLARIDAQGIPVIAVNDGSTDGTAAILSAWLAGSRRQAAYVQTHPANRGKAAALHTGFALAKTLGFTHAVSIDTDGQLAPEQIPQVLAVAQSNPDALVLGNRDAAAKDYPYRSRLGRRAANLLVWMETGARISDSQCGLRVYPLAMDELFACRAGRYGFETEIIVRAAWGGWGVVETPADCTYFSASERVSHFRPWRDSVRAAWMHAQLIGRKLAPWAHRGAKGSRSASGQSALPSWREVLRWLSPRDAWRQIKKDRPEGSDRTAMAGSLAIGAFIGTLPLYSLQTVIGLYTARRLNLNPLGVVLGTQVACPPVGIFLAIASVAFGSIVLHGGIPPLSDFEPLWQGWNGIFKVGPWFFVDWILGSVVVATLCMFLVFFLSDWLLRRIPVEPA